MSRPDEPPPPSMSKPPQPPLETPYPPPGYPPPAWTSRVGEALGPALCVAGIGVAAGGLFALPIQAFEFTRGTDLGYLQLHQLASFYADRPVRKGVPTPMSSLAQFWWQWGLVSAGGLLVALACATILVAGARRAIAWVLAAVAVATGVVHAVALGQTSDYRSFLVLFRPVDSLYKQAGSGIWVGFIGLALLAAAGIVSALSVRRALRPAR